MTRRKPSRLALTLMEVSAVYLDPYADFDHECPDEGYCPSCGSFTPPPVSLEVLEALASASRRGRSAAIPVRRKKLEV